MVIVGQRFEDETYFLPELVFAGETLRKIAEIIKPQLQEKAAVDKALGKIVIGTVAGDATSVMRGQVPEWQLCFLKRGPADGVAAGLMRMISSANWSTRSSSPISGDSR
mgnify:CR=1 FL=1